MSDLREIAQKVNEERLQEQRDADPAGMTKRERHIHEEFLRRGHITTFQHDKGDRQEYWTYRAALDGRILQGEIADRSSYLDSHTAMTWAEKRIKAEIEIEMRTAFDQLLGRTS